MSLAPAPGVAMRECDAEKVAALALAQELDARATLAPFRSQ
jgi:hypothetical protein